MEAKELMIGDWISCNGFQRQIDFIDLQSIFFNQDIAEPIPLTAEILKLNAFDGHFLWLKEGETNGDTEYVSMEYTEEGTMFFFIRRTFNDGQFKGVVHFVHELQHALRLCGLNDLANNFKL